MLRACPAFPRGWHRAARQRADKIDGSRIQNPAYGPLNKTPDAKASGVLFFKAVKAFFRPVRVPIPGWDAYTYNMKV